ncbi:unnamed protein product [Anisakis simplex]|uniref:Uncharacterized protein n=1 Tax=Anisakis simplex TaxID=6269 RepID=A0A0M3JNH8_ANISI|nr:unnamed protein product [Anisakis simplex]
MATLPNGLAFGGGAGGLAQLNGTIQFQQHPANNQLIAMNPPTTAAPPPPNGTIYHPQMYPQHLLPQPLYPPQHFANAAAAQQHQLVGFCANIEKFIAGSMIVKSFTNEILHTENFNERLMEI